MKCLKRLHLFLHTVRYLRPEQIGWRLWLRGKAAFDRRRGRALSSRLAPVAQRIASRVHPTRFLPGLYALSSLASQARQELETNAERVLAGAFTFQNHTEQFGQEVSWSAPGTTLLWRYHLHYFDYALTLGLAAVAAPDRREAYAARLKGLIESWWAENPLGQGDGWRPYPLALRIVNWIYAARCFAGTWPRAFQEQLNESIAMQALFMCRHMEYDVGGNHLLKNAKAVYLAGLYGNGPGAETLIDLGERLLLRELDRQILPDGGHYERSAHYHRIVLIDWLEALSAAGLSRRAWPDRAMERLRSATAYLAGILHPDGEIPLFGDATVEWPATPDLLAGASHLVFAEVPMAVPGPWSAAIGAPVQATRSSPLEKQEAHLRAYPESGYYILRSGSVHAMIDSGPPCPPDLPAHAHSDGLSLEVSWNGQRVVVDPGTYLYQHGPWRRYLRSTAAHNTLFVPGHEQTETWGQFRAARRAVPLSAARGLEVDIAWFTGGVRYATDPTLEHRRWLLVWPDGLLVVDRLSRPVPAARARLLLAPGHLPTALDHKHVLGISGPAGQFSAVAAGQLSVLVPGDGPGPGWYSPRFGLLEQTVTLQWEPNTGPWFGFALMSGGVPAELRLSADGAVTLVTQSRQICCTLTAAGLILR